MKEYASRPIDRFAFRFKNYTYRPIRLCLDDSQGLASTILLCCAIDLLAKFSSGNLKNFGNRAKYIAFLNEYFPAKYDPDKFYEFVRCGLVHSYSMEDRYTILCRDEPWARQIHLQNRCQVYTGCCPNSFSKNQKLAFDISNANKTLE